MVPSICGAMGGAGWLVMLLLWAVLIAAVVWGVTRLFPNAPPPSQPHRLDDVSPPLVGAGRR